MNNLELTTEQEKTIALMQYHQTEVFAIQDEEGEVFIFEGDEETERVNFLADIEGTEEADIDANFLIYCQNNLTQVEEYNEDDYDNDYLVLNDEEANEKAKEYILNSLWAFTPSFLSNRTGLDREVFEAIQSNGKCEGNNDTMLNIVEKLDDLDGFVQSAISADGRGHFIGSYDGHEAEEITPNGETFYIYRIN